MKTPGQRIKDLVEDSDIKLKNLPDVLGIDARTLNRIASGEIQTVNSEILIAAAKQFDVSVDYLLGLSPTKKNSIALSQLRLSDKACRKLASGEIDGETLSRLMEHEEFGTLIFAAKKYLTDAEAQGIGAYNTIVGAAAQAMRSQAGTTADPGSVYEGAAEVRMQKADAEQIAMKKIQELSAQIVRESKPTPSAPKSNGKEWEQELIQIAQEARNANLSEEEKIDLITERTLAAVGTANGVNPTVLKMLRPIYKFLFKQQIKKGKLNVTDQHLQEVLESIDKTMAESN